MWHVTCFLFYIYFELALQLQILSLFSFCYLSPPLNAFPTFPQLFRCISHNFTIVCLMDRHFCQDPMVSKMIIASSQLGCSEEIITIAAVLSVQVNLFAFVITNCFENNFNKFVLKSIFIPRLENVERNLSIYHHTKIQLNIIVQSS